MMTVFGDVCFRG